MIEEMGFLSRLDAAAQYWEQVKRGEKEREESEEIRKEKEKRDDEKFRREMEW